MSIVPHGALMLDADLSIKVNEGQIHVSASEADDDIRVIADEKAIEATRTLSRRFLLQTADTCCRMTGKTIAFQVGAKRVFCLLPQSNLLGRLLGLNGGVKLNSLATAWRLLRGS